MLAYLMSCHMCFCFLTSFSYLLLFLSFQFGCSRQWIGTTNTRQTYIAEVSLLLLLYLNTAHVLVYPCYCCIYAYKYVFKNQWTCKVIEYNNPDFRCAPPKVRKDMSKLKLTGYMGMKLLHCLTYQKVLQISHIWAISILMILIMWGTSLSQMGKKCMSSYQDIHFFIPRLHTKTGNK